VNLAFGYIAQWAFQLSEDPQTLEQALAAAQRAVALNDSLARAHVNLGYVYLLQKHYEQALMELERAVALEPNGAENYASLAEVLSRVGRPEEALRVAEEALRRQPFVTNEYLGSVGSAYVLADGTKKRLAP
jgi:tetratricopeptide (TPR) repeat protein